MRTPRRFFPVFDCMSARIAPSAISLIPPVMHVAMSTAAVMDSTGEPGTNPSSGATGPIIMTPPTGGGGIGSVC
jgi:hypothetical protein